MSRYDRYFNITVKREVYEALRKLAEAHGLSVPDFLSLVVKTYNLVDALNRAVNLLGKSQYITGNSPVNQTSTTSSKHSANGKAPATSTSSSSKTRQEKSSGHVWCRKKSEIRNLEGFLNWVERAYGLVDWWDEEDKYCFETTMPP